MHPHLEKIGDTTLLRVHDQGPVLDANGLRDLVGDA
ncbi:DUF4180 domain-containing protein, partial [Stenotrophomonas sp. MA5]